MRYTYLTLAILGVLVPGYFLMGWLQSNEWSLTELFQYWVSDGAGRAVIALWGLSAVSLSVFILAELPVRKDALCLIALPVTFCLGIACGLPFYLLLRSRNID